MPGHSQGGGHLAGGAAVSDQVFHSQRFILAELAIAQSVVLLAVGGGRQFQKRSLQIIKDHQSNKKGDEEGGSVALLKVLGYFFNPCQVLMKQTIRLVRTKLQQRILQCILQCILQLLMKLAACTQGTLQLQSYKY